MSSFLTNFSDHLKDNQHEEALALAIEEFQRTSDPWQEFFRCLSTLCRRKSENFAVIQALIDAFKQWKSRNGSTVMIPRFETSLFLFHLPTGVLRDFCDLFPARKEFLVETIRRELTNGPIEKHLLNIIVTMNFQLEFSQDEILLPLILFIKDHLIHIFVDKRSELEDYLLVLLDHLYENGGQRLRQILANEFGIRDQNFINKKAMKRLAVRFWNSLGHERADRYPHLSTLQDRSTLGYLIGVKYNGSPDEKPMSNDCWNESVEDLVNGNRELSLYLLELLVENNDSAAVDYWLQQLQLPNQSLPQSVKSYLRNRRYNPSADRVSRNPPTPQTRYYRISESKTPIHFVDSIPVYQQLLNRLFNDKKSTRELMVGFDCEWKPMYRNSATAKQRISIMQIAFPEEIFLLDLLYFFHKCDDQTIQERLANRLFNDEQLTVLCYGFSSDMTMLISSFPIFHQALNSGTTLLDLAMVQAELTKQGLVEFPYKLTEKSPPTKDKGLSELVRLCFGKGLDKSEQCSNWEKRPLRDAQRLYAATDASCLLDLYRFLRDELRVPSDFLQSFRGRKPTKTNDAKSKTNGDESPFPIDQQ